MFYLKKTKEHDNVHITHTHCSKEKENSNKVYRGISIDT